MAKKNAVAENEEKCTTKKASNKQETQVELAKNGLIAKY